MNETLSQPKDNLAIRFKKVCRLMAVVNSRKKAILSSSIEGVEIARLLKAMANDLIKKSPFLLDKNFNHFYSRGKGFVPRVVWLSFTKTGYPNSSLSVTLCFDKNGKGCVLGLMEAKERPTGRINLVIRKTAECIPDLDLDGPKQAGMFNNMYFNPMDFFIDNFCTDDFIKHFEDSIRMLFSMSDDAT